MDMDRDIPLCPGKAALVGYTFVRHIGFMLDELSSQGLDLWRDERQGWHWRWRGTAFPIGAWLLGDWRGRGGCGRHTLPKYLCDRIER